MPLALGDIAGDSPREAEGDPDWLPPEEAEAALQVPIQVEFGRGLEGIVRDADLPEAFEGEREDLSAGVAVGGEVDPALLVPEVDRIKTAPAGAVPSEGVILRLHGPAFVESLLEQPQRLHCTRGIFGLQRSGRDALLDVIQEGLGLRAQGGRDLLEGRVDRVPNGRSPERDEEMAAEMQTHELGERERDGRRTRGALDQPVATLAPVLLRCEGESGLLKNDQVLPDGPAAAVHLARQLSDRAATPDGQDVQQPPLPDHLVTSVHTTPIGLRTKRPQPPTGNGPYPRPGPNCNKKHRRRSPFRMILCLPREPTGIARDTCRTVLGSRFSARGSPPLPDNSLDT